MAHERGLLGEIEHDLLSGRPIADVLRKVVILGGRSGSAELREWASRELKGFDGVDADDLPSYRRIPAAICVDAIVGNYQVTKQPLPYSNLPDFVRDGMPEDFLLRHGVGQIEAWAAATDSINLSLPGADIIGSYLDRQARQPQHMLAIYWAIPPSTFAGVLDQVRTALAEVVGELIAATPPSQETPTPEQAAQAVNVAISGSKSARVTVTTQQSGTASSITPAPSDADPPWWTRGRKIGAVVVGAFTIIGAVAAVIVLFV